jgi:hypoxia up-regulated 1
VGVKPDDSLVFGSNAVALEARSPEFTFPQARVLLGRSASHPAVTELLANGFYPQPVAEHKASGKARIGADAANARPTEEYFAMILKHAAQQGEAFGAAPGSNTRYVITVPSSFGQAERQAVRDAGKMANLEILALIDEGTAAALQYASTRDGGFAKKTNVMYFNMGAHALQVVIAEHSGGTANRAFKVLSKAYDEGVGGTHFDSRVLDIIATEVNKKRGTADGSDDDIRKLGRPVGQLKKIAMKCKMTLSANEESKWFVDGLGTETDLIVSGMVLRHDYEEKIADLLAKVLPTVKRAISEAGLTEKDVQMVELLGGGARTPAVQALLTKFFGDKMELGVHLNGDEAMALGSAFQGARLSPTMRVRKVSMADALAHPVDATFSCADGSGWSKKAAVQTAPIFKRGAQLNFKRSVVLAPKCADASDLVVTLSSGEATIGTFTIGGFGAYKSANALPAAKKEGEKKANYRVSFSFLLNHDAITSLDGAQAYMQRGKAGKPLKADALDVSADSSKNTATPLSKEELASSVERLDAIESKEKEKQAKDDVANELEAYIGAAKRTFAEKDADADEDEDEDEDDTNMMWSLSTLEEREPALAAAIAASEWFDGANAEKTALAEFQSHLDTVKAVGEPLQRRVVSAQARKTALHQAKVFFKDSKMRIGPLKKSHPWITKAQKLKTKKLIEAEEVALAEKAEAQKKLKPDEEPLFDKETVVEIKKKINDALQELEDTPEPPPPPPKVEEKKEGGEL